MTSNNWKDSLKEIIDIPEYHVWDPESSRSKSKPHLIDYGRDTSILLFYIFRNVTIPEISLISSKVTKASASSSLYIPESYVIKAENHIKVLRIIISKQLFHSLPTQLKLGYLDILYSILKRSVFDVVRLLIATSSAEDRRESIFIALLNLLDDKIALPAYVCKRIINITSIIGTAGVSIRDMKVLLETLRYPTEWTTSLLQALNNLVKLDVSVLKAYPLHFFDFGGLKSGMYIPDVSLTSFSREFQFFTWFRVEHFDITTNNQHILTIRNGNSKGVDLYLDNKKLCFEIHYNKNDKFHIRLDKHQINRGVWYHIALRLSKPRLSLFSSDELVVHLDHSLVYQEFVRFPTSFHENSQMIIGANLNGQIGPLYFLHDSVAPGIVELLAKYDGGKSLDLSIHLLNPAADMISPATTINADKRLIGFSSKLSSFYHPNRCINRYALDIYGGRHARLGEATNIWQIRGVKDMLGAMGGIACILPVIPRLFIENETRRNHVAHSTHSSGLGTSLGEFTDPIEYESDTIFDSEFLSSFESDKNDSVVSGSISLVFSILAKCLVPHKTHLRQFKAIGGIDLIEYALRCLPGNILEMESELCILSILQLREAVSVDPELDSAIVNRLLCNFEIWAKASYSLQTTLMSVLMALIQAQPEFFLQISGIQRLLQGIQACYVSEDLNVSNDIDHPSTENEVISNPMTIKQEILMSDIKKFNAEKSIQSLDIDDSIAINNNVAGDSSATSTPYSVVTPSRSVDSKNRMRRLNKSASFKLTLSQEIFNSDLDTDIEEDHTTAAGESEFASVGSLSRSFSKGNIKNVSFFNEEVIIEERDSEVSTAYSGNETNDVDIKDMNATMDSITSTTNLEGLESTEILTSEQKKYFRDCLMTMIMTLALFGRTENEIFPVLDFMSSCKNSIVLNEVSELLLCLLVEGGSSIVTTITTACKGPEEFASFIIFRLIHQQHENIRCIGLRLLTHYYLRLEAVPSSVINLSLKKHKGSISRTIESLNIINASSTSIQRLVAVGGLALLINIISEHSRYCSGITYSALLEMILSKPGSRSQVTIKYTDLHLPSSMSTIYAAKSSGDSSSSGINNLNVHSQKTVVFAAHYLSPDQVHDEGESTINSIVLPLFFTCIPYMPLEMFDQIYSDMLALLKHSTGNRDTFCDLPLWHSCMFEMILRLLNVSPIPSGDIEIHESAVLIKDYNKLFSKDILLILQKFSNIVLQPNESNDDKLSLDILEILSDDLKETEQESEALSWLSSKAPQSLDSDVVMDFTFTIGMKVYATLLLHAVERKSGWKELEKTLSQTFNSSLGAAAARSVLSHLINELTFSIKSKYRSITKFLKSTNFNESSSARDHLENVLGTFYLSAQFALLDSFCICEFIPNWDIALKRRMIFQEEHVDDSYDDVDFVDLPLHSPSQPSHQAFKIEKLLLEFFESSCEQLDFKGLPIPTSFSKFIDFSHHWIDISSLPFPPCQETKKNDCDISNQQTGSDFNFPKRLSKKSSFAREGELRPLERRHNKIQGQLILALQSLRYFDTIFWPYQLGSIRNTDWLAFHNDNLSSSTSNKRNSKASNDIPALHLKSFTLFSSTMRLGIYIMNKLSPFTDLASLNIRRLIALLSIDEKELGPVRSPVTEWMMTVFVHTTVNLQRIIHSLEGLFRFIGLKCCALKVLSIGKRSLADEEQARIDLSEDEKILDDIQHNSTISVMLEKFFNSDAGQRLLEFIRDSFELLMKIYDKARDSLENILEIKSFHLFEFLIVRLQYDFPKSDTSSFYDGSHQSHESNKPNVVVEATNSTENSSSPDHIAIVDDVYYDSDEDTTIKSSKIGGGFEIPFKHQSSFVNFEIENIGIKAITKFISWLRQPYFQCNIIQSVDLIKCIISLDDFEKTCLSNYRFELGHIFEKLNEFRATSEISVGEQMVELKELSESVFTMMRSRDFTKKRSFRAVEALRIKKVALDWQEMYHSFEADWSPWYNEDYINVYNKIEISSHRGRAYYELARFKDSRMRRMVLKALSEPINHANAAYLEGKIRDQEEYEATLKGSPLPYSDRNKDFDQEKSHATFIKPEKYKSMIDSENSNMTAAWGEDEDDSDLIENINTLSQTSDTNNSLSPNISSSANQKSNVVLGLNNFFIPQTIERPLWTYTFAWETDEKIQIIAEATQILLEQVIIGSILLTNKFLYFHPKKQIGGLTKNGKPFYDRRWHLDRLVETYGRRYLLQNCGIELFFIDSTEVFFAFKSLPEVRLFFKHLMRQHIPMLSTARTLNPRHLMSRSMWTEMWRKRQISNFEYLMKLNVIAGRSYNDITQYPVMPWVLRDYKSSELDFSNEDVFRDLKKPVGALNPSRLKEFIDRYKSFGDDEEVPKFMYGSHYSSAGVVLHFLIRQEPFTSMAINLQGGRFDCPDRIFFDIQRTWNGCNNSMSDVKELIPELYCCPELFLNMNNLPLGELQEGSVVNNVKLPPWANNNVFEFIRLHREALESEYVSEHLNDWIDLIFGYKQVGQAAIDAHNVFYYLTYENAVNIDAIEDDLSRDAAKAQVTHFGQTPSLLFTKEHPKRLPKRECMIPLCSDVESLQTLRLFTPSKQFSLHGEHKSVVSVQSTSDRLVAVHSDLTVAYYRWSSFPDGEGLPFQFRPDRKRTLPSESMSSSFEILMRKHKHSSNNRSSSLSSLSEAKRENSETISTLTEESSESTTTATKSNTNNLTLEKVSKSIISKIWGTSSSSKNSNNSVISPSLASPSILSQDSKKTEEHKFEVEILYSSHDIIEDFQELEVELSSTSSNAPAITASSALSYSFTTSINRLSSNHVVVSLDDSSSGRIISCGYWDNSLKIHAVDSLKDISSAANSHIGQITCVQAGYQGGITLITGGDDCTCRVWVLENPALALSYAEDGLHDIDTGYGVVDSNLQCVRVLCGHYTQITAIYYSSDIDIVFSASASGLLCLHSVRQGLYLRSITALLGHHVKVILSTSSGYLVVYSSSHKKLYLFWINGQILKTIEVGDVRIESLAVNGFSTILVCGMADGTLVFRTLWDLEEVHRMDNLRIHGSIRCMWFTDDQQFLLIGSESGAISILTDPEARWKMLHAAIQKTPLLGTTLLDS